MAKMAGAALIAGVLRKQLHHMIPIFVGGRPDGPTYPLSFYVHRILLHPGMQRYFRKHAPDLVHRKGYGTAQTLANTDMEYRLKMLNEYHQKLEGTRLLGGVARK